MSVQKRIFDGWRESLVRFLSGWRALIMFDAVFKLLSFAMIAPLSTWFLVAVLRWSGDAAVSNYDLISFFLSVPGLLLIVVSGTAAFAVFYVELGGMTLIALGIARGRRISALRTLVFIGSRLRHLWVLGLCQFLAFAMIASVVLATAVAVKSTLLGGGDIYFYFRVRPPAFWLAAAIVGAAAALAVIASAYLFVRWVYAVPLLLLEDLRPREAMAQSGRMSHAAGRWRILGRMTARAAGVMALVGLSALGHGLLDWVFVTVAGSNIGRMIAATALSLSVGLTLGVVVGFASVLAFAELFACLYTELRPGIGPPAELDVDARRGSRDRRFGVGSALIVGAVGLVGLAVAITISLIGELDLERTVLTTAHRGASKAAPENTIAALRQAVADGADYAEIDVQRTADGVVVLLHDTDLRRVAGVNSGIWELSLDEVQRLDVGSWFSAEFAGERAPTLTEAIAATKGKMRLNIELKVNGRDDGLAAEVARVLKETGCGEACVVSSLDIATMREIAQYNPNLRRGLIVTAAVGDVSRFDVDFLAINAGSATRDLIDRVHRAGMEAHVWSLSDPVRMQTMIHLGADNILTSRPDVLVRLLQARAKMSDAEKALLMLADLTPGRLWSLGRSQDDGEP